MQRDNTVEAMLECLGDLENHPDENLVPYEEFELLDGETYYFTPGGFLYRKDPGSEEVGGFFCGYLADEVWQHRTDDASGSLSLPNAGRSPRGSGLSPFETVLAEVQTGNGAS